ncbi:MAG TPA: molybdenum cofactor biosynthesis protein MoaB [Methanocorpusculum sp.]|nr:molybdenum cofactor biosynthesis protein MoaB [Methanocorpusculum sp.]HJJ40226.1 molybdenum cofactor biosynthesis protein MoaB [Methanocorpusculum sp.]HJJ49615.1 molybdenum cofactor biosynthesis protein MoaB [Methanocorpusculum sp.]HJJ57700.1 molybdenum cofactor biosynthesis protein MoaB [Methanocorpusculum sp.]
MSDSHHHDVAVHAVVITVSTTRTEKTDLSGKIIQNLFKAADMQCANPILVSDEAVKIAEAVSSALSGEGNCIVVNGGTGITRDDVTIEAVTPLFEKTLAGFGELFRMKSVTQVGTAVILSRASAGVVNGKAVFCIPGSPKACQLATEEIIVPEIKHILTHAGQ